MLVGFQGHIQQFDRMTRTEYSYHPVQASAPVAMTTPYAAPQITQGTYAAPQPKQMTYAAPRTTHMNAAPRLSDVESDENDPCLDVERWKRRGN